MRLTRGSLASAFSLLFDILATRALRMPSRRPALPPLALMRLIGIRFVVELDDDVRFAVDGVFDGVVQLQVELGVTARDARRSRGLLRCSYSAFELAGLRTARFRGGGRQEQHGEQRDQDIARPHTAFPAALISMGRHVHALL